MWFLLADSSCCRLAALRLQVTTEHFAGPSAGPLCHSPRQPCFLSVSPTLRLAPAGPAVCEEGASRGNRQQGMHSGLLDCYQLSRGSDSPASVGRPWVWVVFDLP